MLDVLDELFTFRLVETVIPVTVSKPHELPYQLTGEVLEGEKRKREREREVACFSYTLL